LATATTRSAEACFPELILVLGLGEVWAPAARQLGTRAGTPRYSFIPSQMQPEASLKKATITRQLVSGSPELETVVDNFATDPQLDWMLASTSVVRAHKIIASRVNAVLVQVGQLTMARYEILGHLCNSGDGELAVRELKRASFLHPPTMTYNLDWLEARDLVARRGNRADRRTVIIRVTDAGRTLFGQANAALGKIHFGLVGLTDADARAVAKSLAKVQPT